MIPGPQAVAARVVRIGEDGGRPSGRVSVRGAEIDVALDLVPQVRVGDMVLVQAGVALCRIRDGREAPRQGE